MTEHYEETLAGLDKKETEEYLREGRRIDLYFNGEFVTNWLETFKVKPFKVVNKDMHVFNRYRMKREDVWFKFENSYYYLKILGDQTIGTCRKLFDRAAIRRAKRNEK